MQKIRLHTDTDFTSLLRTDLYQVFLCTCPANLPFSFATHPWFVINQKGRISRWEVLCAKNTREPDLGHLYHNVFLPYKGIHIFPYLLPYHWKGTLRGYSEGGKNSFAQKMAEFIEHSKETYPYAQTYSLPGPNSNTYAGWVLKHFPKFPVTLPLNAIGKNYGSHRE